MKGTICNSCFSLLNITLLKWFFFPDWWGFEFCVSFCSSCRFYSQLYYLHVRLLSLITLRNPSTCCKEKMLQDILRHTDMLLVERWFVWGEQACWDKSDCWKAFLQITGLARKMGWLILFFWSVFWLDARFVLRTWYALPYQNLMKEILLASFYRWERWLSMVFKPTLHLIIKWQGLVSQA